MRSTDDHVGEGRAAPDRYDPRGEGPAPAWVVQDLGEAFPGIESRLGVCGGKACIVRTRIPVWLLVQARRLNTSESDLLRAYPTLRAEDLANAWAYQRSHPDEIERQIRDNEAA